MRKIWKNATAVLMTAILSLSSGTIPIFAEEEGNSNTFYGVESEVLERNSDVFRMDEYSVEESGSTRSVTVRLQEAVKGVQVAIWSEEGWQDDLRWYTLEGNDTEWSTKLDLSSLKHDGLVHAHFYTHENQFLKDITFYADSEDIGNDSVSISGNGSTRQIDVYTSNSAGGIRAAVWSAVNGQDDLKWYSLVNSDGNHWSGTIDLDVLKHAGTVQIHLYSGSSFLGNTEFEVTAADLSKDSVYVSTSGADRQMTFTTKQSLSNARVAVWSSENSQDDIVWYSMDEKPDGTWQAVIKGENIKHAGTCFAHIYSDNSFMGAAEFVMTADEIVKNSAVISDNLTSKSITVTTKENVTTMTAAVWSAEKGQDDLIWYPLTQLNGVWTGEIELKKIKHAGNCYVHVYSGNTMITNTSFVVKGEELVSDTISISDNGSARNLTVTTKGNYSNMQVAIWSNTNSQDDILWYSMNKQSNRWTTTILGSNLKHSGVVHAHVYADGKFLIADTFTVTDTDISKNEFKVTATGNTITAQASIGDSSLKNVRVAIWSNTGGQDDIGWYSLTKSGTTWKTTINTNNLKHTGSCCAHFYTGENTFLGNVEFTYQSDSFKNKNIYLSGTDSLKTLHVNSPNRSNVSAAIWSDEGGQDDINWYSLTKKTDGTWAVDFAVTTLKHSGTIQIHVYADNNSVLVGTMTDSISLSEYNNSKSSSAAPGPYYCQHDEPWASYTVNKGKDHLGGSGGIGCGPTSFAMISSILTGKSYTPIDVASYMDQNGWIGSDGTYTGFWSNGVGHFGVKYERHTYSKSAVEQALRSGKAVIISTRAVNKRTGNGGTL